MATDLCYWLGSDEDRDLRGMEAHEAHVCYAQEPEADIEIDYQNQYCLVDAHRDCPFYREPSAPPPPPPAIAPEDEEDAYGPIPRRLPALRVILWGMGIVAVAALLYTYGSALLAPTPTATPTAALAAGVAPAVTPTFSPMPTDTAVSAAPTPTFEFLNPTATPTAFPGGAVYGLSPDPGAAGWVASDEERGNHLGDSYLYTGVFDGIIYHGVMQFDLSAVPRGATIHAATIEISGLDARRMNGSGVWEMRILARDADEAWSRMTFQDAHNASVQWTLPPALGAGDLAVGETNLFELSREQTQDLEQRLLDEHFTLSFRLDGPLAGESSVFAWDTGYGPATQGHRPRLLLNVGEAPGTPVPTATRPPTLTPTASLTPTPSLTPTASLTPTPTDTPVYWVVTSTPTAENAVTAAAIAVEETARAETTGTATATPEFMATATPFYIIVTNTPTPENRATAAYIRALGTANAILTGTPLNACSKYLACGILSTSGRISFTRGKGCITISPSGPRDSSSGSTRYSPATRSYSTRSGKRSFWILVA